MDTRAERRCSRCCPTREVLADAEPTAEPGQRGLGDQPIPAMTACIGALLRCQGRRNAMLCSSSATPEVGGRRPAPS